MNKKEFYLDYNSTTPIAPDVIVAMQPFLKEIYGNASSLHNLGQKAKEYLESSRAKISNLINAQTPEEIVFTGCGTESDNIAIKGIALANKSKGNHIITSKIEHHAVLYPCKYLEKNGFKLTYISPDNACRINPEDVKNAITPETILVSIMHANNETGTIQPITQIAKIIKEFNSERIKSGIPKIIFHTDAIQTVGKLKIDVGELGVDLLSISAHKFYGPKGVGAVYVKRGINITPLFHGGHHEHNIRAGTENLAGIVGMSEALELANSKLEQEQNRLLKLRDALEKGIKNKIENVCINAESSQRLPNTSNVSFESIEGESLLLSLNIEGIYTSSGSACASRSLELSHVLKAMGIDPRIAQGTIRFSLGNKTTIDDINYVLEKLPPIVSRLRKISPLGKSAAK